MGNCHNEENNSELEVYTPQLAQYKLLYVIGRGGFGRVWKVKNGKRFYAMKEMYKSKIVAKQSTISVMNERYLLESLNHPFLVNMKTAFQTAQNLYIVLDLMEGGDLRYHLCKHKNFNEEQTSIALHNPEGSSSFVSLLGWIIHRDIKPENLVFDSNGYLRITDLGIARIWRPNNRIDTSGTPGYMAPEVMLRQPHGVAVDYFALGVLTYECLTGKRPYQGKTRKQVKEQILAKQIRLAPSLIYSNQVVDFVNRLIERKPFHRLGLNGPEEVMSHPWLKDIDWQVYKDKVTSPPFKILSSDNFDPKFTQKTSEPEKAQVDQEVFKGFTFNNGDYNLEQTDIGTNRQVINQKVSTKLS